MLITLVIWIVVISLVYYLLRFLPLPEPAPAILKVIFIVVLILVVLATLGSFFGFWNGKLL